MKIQFENLEEKEIRKKITMEVVVRFENIIPGDEKQDKFIQSYSKSAIFKNSINRENRIAKFIRAVVDMNKRYCKRYSQKSLSIKANFKTYLNSSTSRRILIDDRTLTLVEI